MHSEIFACDMAHMFEEFTLQRILLWVEDFSISEQFGGHWINQLSLGVLVQELLPQLEYVVSQCYDPNFIFYVRWFLDVNSILLWIDILESLDNET